jgi:hypothetical protein
MCSIWLEQCLNLTLGSLQTEPLTMCDQCKVSDPVNNDGTYMSRSNLFSSVEDSIYSTCYTFKKKFVFCLPGLYFGFCMILNINSNSFPNSITRIVFVTETDSVGSISLLRGLSLSRRQTQKAVLAYCADCLCHGDRLSRQY